MIQILVKLHIVTERDRDLALSQCMSETINPRIHIKRLGNSKKPYKVIVEGHPEYSFSYPQAAFEFCEEVYGEPVMVDIQP